MIIKLTNEEIAKSKKYAEDVLPTSKDMYSKRNQNNDENSIDQNVIGKLAEYAVYRYLSSKGKKVTEPDVKIYSGQRKKFDPDLNDEHFGYHVKSQKKSQAERYGSSWVFTTKDGIIKNPKDTDVIVLCEVDGNNVEIKAFIKASRVVGLYTDPFVPQLRDYKRVLMWDDICKLLPKK